MNPIRTRRAALALAASATVFCIAAPGSHVFAAAGQLAAGNQLASAAPATAMPATASAVPATASPTSSPAALSLPTGTPAPSPSPAFEATPAPRRHGKPSAADVPSPTPTPTSPAFSSLDGYWEVVLQTPTTNSYSRFELHQTGDAVTGTWSADGKTFPLEGNYDGRQFKFVAKGAAKDVTLAGYVDGATDMVGIVDKGEPDPTAFTASHRGTYDITIFPKHAKKR